MVDPDFLKLFRCPIHGTPLQVADDRLLQELNRQIHASRIVNHAGDVVENPLEGGLIDRDGSVLYPVHDRIPSLIEGEAIPLEQLNSPARPVADGRDDARLADQKKTELKEEGASNE